MKKRKVLLVEDEALVAMVAEELLSLLGFEVVSARNAAEALALLAEGGATPTVALVDVGLPGMRGDELAAQLRGSTPDMAILMATGYDNGDLRQRFAADDRVGFLAKPYSEADLGRALAGLGIKTEPA